MSTEEQYYLKSEGKQSGPLTRARVLQKIVDGEVDATTLWWCDGMGEWEPLSTGFDITAPLSAAKPSTEPKEEELRNYQVFGPAFLIVVGMIIASFFAFMYQTTVGDVQNIGLLNNRQVGVQCGIGLALLGALLRRK